MAATSGLRSTKAGERKRLIAKSTIPAMPSVRTRSTRCAQASRSIVAEVQTKASEVTREGSSRASCMAIMPPRETPATAADAIPASSITAETSCARLRSV